MLIKLFEHDMCALLFEEPHVPLMQLLCMCMHYCIGFCFKVKYSFYVAIDCTQLHVCLLQNQSER